MVSICRKLSYEMEFPENADMWPAKKHEGTGLDLSIRKRVVELMGGEIQVKSKEGVGSTFSVILPTC